MINSNTLSDHEVAHSGITCLFIREKENVSPILCMAQVPHFDFVTAAICALKLNVPTLLLVVDYIHLN